MFNRFKDKFQRSTFLQNTSVLLGGTVIASIIPAIIQPILTRIYTPEDIGLFNLYFYLVGIFTSIAGMRYELAVPLPEKKEDTDRVVIITLIASVMVSVVLLLLAVVFRHEMAFYMKSPRMATWIMIVPVGVFFGGVYQAFNYWLVRHQAFKASAINRVSQKLTDSFLMVVLGYLKIGAGQIIGEFTGRAALAVTAMFQAMKKGFTFRSYNKQRMKELAKQYRDFPLFNSLPSLADAIGMYVPGIFISSFYGEAETGYYGVTRFVLSIPLIIISRNISQVLFERFAAKKNKGLPVYHEVKKLFLYLTVSTIPFVIILVFIAPQLFSFVFGDKYFISGEYTQILAVAYALRFVNGSLTVVFSALEKIRIASYWQMYFFFAIVSLGLLQNFDVSMKQFLWILMLVESVSYCIYLYLCFKVSKDYDNSLLKTNL
jgi:O-antigen/teichoic acid export membrane protein